ncbi:Cuticle-degrading protease-like protein [Leptotrombidium deliense]|uniref:Cuticle-degrading protease-like protein n=1 Tax=Leptotrombidium deliense TaxID=299467 RepID=A0A443S614_9ACAR|nr:Cuticle-degrading protease-like protein [Leptotrombidium deliense]
MVSYDFIWHSFCLLISASEILEEIFEKNLSAEEANKLVSERSDYLAEYYKQDEFIENRYMIKFVNGKAMESVMKIIHSKSVPFDETFNIRHEYGFGFGIAVSMSSQSVDIFRKIKEVQYIQQDSIVKLVEEKKDFCTKCRKEKQNRAGWCLARTANPTASIDFFYPRTAGEGITICVVVRK